MMKLYITWGLLAVSLLLPPGALAQSQNAQGLITPSLRAQMEKGAKDERIPVLISFTDRLRFEPAELA